MQRRMNWWHLNSCPPSWVRVYDCKCQKIFYLDMRLESLSHHHNDCGILKIKTLNKRLSWLSYNLPDTLRKTCRLFRICAAWRSRIIPHPSVQMVPSLAALSASNRASLRWTCSIDCHWRFTFINGEITHIKSINRRWEAKTKSCNILPGARLKKKHRWVHQADSAAFHNSIHRLHGSI